MGGRTFRGDADAYVCACECARTIVVPVLLSLALLPRALRVRVEGRSGDKPRAVPGRALVRPRREAGRVGRLMWEVAVAGRGYGGLMAEAGRGDLRGDRCAALVVKVGGARLRVLVLWDLGERTVMGGGMRLTVDGGTMRV